jgi:hypothetical protein
MRRVALLSLFAVASATRSVLAGQNTRATPECVVARRAAGAAGLECARLLSCFVAQLLVLFVLPSVQP